MSESKPAATLEESTAKLLGNLESTTELEKVASCDVNSAGQVVETQDEEAIAAGSEGSFDIEQDVETKGNASVREEDSNLGFVVIKPEASVSSHPQMERQEEDTNVVIIQNPEGLDIDGLDSHILSQVHKVLAESGVESSSIVILNDGDENNSEPKETTTYIIDLNAENDAPEDALNLHISPANCTVIHNQQQLQHLPPSRDHVEIVNTSPLLNTSSSTSVLKPLVSPLNESASSLNSNNVKSASSVSDNVFTQSEAAYADNTVSSKPTCTTSLPKNLNQSSQSQESLSSVPVSSSNTASPPSSSSSSVTTSQVAEQLIHIAKKMIEDSSQGSQKISVDESLGKFVISSPESQQAGGDTSSFESVITMYLSSPNELKLKLKKLKTNSPMIVTRADEELLSDENKENPIPNNSEVDAKEGSSTSVSTTNEDVALTGGQKAGSIVATLSSLASSGVLYRCSECGYSSHNKHYYKQHVDLVHNEERPYKCPHCDYAGKRRHALLEHMVVHSNQRPYSCLHCNASFRKKGHLTNHVKLHLSHRLVHCGVCNIQLPDAEAFEAHLRKIHNTDKLYRCKLCEHTVVERRAMIAHLATHNESIVFSCPNCSSYFNDEDSLLTHMKQAHDIDRKSINTDSDKNSNVGEKSTSSSVTDKEKAVNSASAKSDLSVQSPNIVCSECGYMCGDTQVMKKHMWVHIDSSSKESGVQLRDQAATSKKSTSETNTTIATTTTTTTNNNNSAMGVLKMNVVSGMKSLPENIVYQCTSCKFTSSDNSVFIKHMLLHKTQRNQQAPLSRDNSSGAATTKPHQQDPGGSGTGVVSTRGSLIPMFGPNTTRVTSSADGLSSSSVAKEGKPDSSVPFVFDQPSGRYRCLICGYHCDFQRTIKAHIWKHSGNQNIEYPVFEQAKKNQSSTTSTTFISSSAADQDHHSSLPPVEKPSLPVPSSSSSSSSSPSLLSLQQSSLSTIQPQKSLKMINGKIILPLNSPPTSSPKPTPTLTQVKDIPASGGVHADKRWSQTVIRDAVPTTVHSKAPTTDINGATKSPFSLVTTATTTTNTTAAATVAATATTNATPEPSSPQPLIIEDKIDAVVEIGLEQEVTSTETRTFSTLKFGGETRKPSPINPTLNEEGCTEPSVVVEIVDSVPSSFGLTGMKSQQGSPRVSDLEGSGNEAKLASNFKEMADFKRQQNTEVLKADQEVEKIDTKYNTRKSKAETIKMELRGLKRAATVDEDSSVTTKTEILDASSSQKCLKTFVVKGEIVEVKEEKIIDDMSNDESDGTASSDDTVSAGESSSGATAPPKSGICSSLLAVIEQLRERSRSESLSDKDVPASGKDMPKTRSNKRLKKGSSNSEAMSALSEFHNIERINEGSGEKFRCSLCHYTSHRICNMKIHMKTHRQKKPSECSLCDFASASPELLQEHMLQHCKVRTYACKFCPQSFNHKSTLRAHMRAHKDHEPFLCAYCVFETTNPNEYREHMHVHSGCSSRLRCPGCDHVMNSKEELTPHLMICKGKSSSPPNASADNNSKIPKASTNVGGKSPKQRDTTSDAKGLPPSGTPVPQLTKHSCVVEGCSFSSYSLKELQDHLSVHCNPSLMVCDLCDFKALHSRSLKSHMKRHANDQRYVQQPLEQYKCNLCGYVCHHLPSLKSHMWRHASDQSYSYEFTNDVINAAIDHDSRADVSDSQPDDPELLNRFINSESRIMEGELTNYEKGDGQRPTCWVTFRCCSCGFETINKAKLNIHMRSHSDIIQQTLDVTPRKPGYDKSNHFLRGGATTSHQQPLTVKSGNRRSSSTEENNEPLSKVKKGN